MSKITITLTEDQVRGLVALLTNRVRIHSEAAARAPHDEVLDKKILKKVAFYTRILTKISQELVK